MEKIRLLNRNEYSVIPGGFQLKENAEGSTGLLRMILAEKEGVSFDSIEADFSVEENISNILLVDPNNSAENVVSGYTILKSVEKCNNYLIGHDTQQLEGGGYDMKEIRGAVYVVLLAKPDLYSQMEALKETVDMVVLSELEV